MMRYEELCQCLETALQTMEFEIERDCVVHTPESDRLADCVHTQLRQLRMCLEVGHIAEALRLLVSVATMCQSFGYFDLINWNDGTGKHQPINCLNFWENE